MKPSIRVLKLEVPACGEMDFGREATAAFDQYGAAPPSRDTA